jgi:bifunctional non-homologous end joining protein LigD
MKTAKANTKPQSAAADKKAAPKAPPASDYELKVGKATLKLTNQQKLYWPDDQITKGSLVKYYADIAPFILPYLKDRPQSLHRFPNGIIDAGFYQKDIDTAIAPKWLRTEKVYSDSNHEDLDYLICNDKETLIYMANLGCIEMHPWNSRYDYLTQPDWLVIDLDPEDIAFAEVAKTALTVRKVLESLGIEGYCKTSGATGLHIFAPLAAKYEYEVVRNFGQLIAKRVHELLPDTTSILRQPRQRQKKVYLDYLQNSKGQTLAAPYSVRPRPGAPVSTPLDWSEVNSKLDPKTFTIQTIFKRLDKKGDLWKPVLGRGNDLAKALKKAEANKGWPK